jgi:hypothetical protein
MFNYNMFTADKNQSNHTEVVMESIETLKSREGKYFIGYCEVSFEQGAGAWVRIYNPINSRVNLYVSQWTIMDFSQTPYLAELWLNAIPSGSPVTINTIIASNTSVLPLPESKMRLQSVSNAMGIPIGGLKTMMRKGMPGSMMLGRERGKYILSPGGSFLIWISELGAATSKTSGCIMLEWWEE